MNFTFRVILCALVLALTTTSIIAQARIITSDDINMTDYENVMQEDDGTADTTTQAPVAAPATQLAPVTEQQPSVAATPQVPPAKPKRHSSAGSSSSQAGFCVVCANSGKSGGTSAPSVGASLAPVVQLSSDAISLELNDIGSNSISQRIAERADEVRSYSPGGHCWTGNPRESRDGVKNILYESDPSQVPRGSLNTSWIGDAARLATGHLLARGFTDLMAPGQILNHLPNPCLAPPGAVLVYSGGPEICNDGIRCGHVEVKIGAVGALGFASDYRSRLPVTGSCSTSSPRRDGNRGFTLQAILVAPGTIPSDDLAVRTASNPQD